VGLFESDEAALPGIARAVRPTCVVVTNLFRDQLDRYGELDGIAVRWREAFADLPADATLVLNADDPLVATLGEGTGHSVVYYGLDLPSGRFERPPESADSISCRRCGALLDYAAVYYGHLGRYRCPRCGWTRPTPDVSGRAVDAHGLEGSRLSVAVGTETVDVELRVPGLYNAYNALAALAAAHVLGIPATDAATALGSVSAAFGRAERLEVGGHTVWLLLIKNPTGADEVLRLLTEAPGPIDLLAVLNDNDADGRDLAAHLRRVTFAGTRAEDMALRFKYAGYDDPQAPIVRDPLAALDAALTPHAPLSRAQERRAGPAIPRVGIGGPVSHGVGGEGSPLYVVATYTAMLALRRGLAARGVVPHYLERS